MTDIENEIAGAMQFRKTITRLNPAATDLPGGRPTESILAERHVTHGDFERNAEISQAIKALLRYYTPADMCKVHLEVLDMHALKFARILSGQSDFAEHWDDIAGYAKLAAKACTK